MPGRLRHPARGTARPPAFRLRVATYNIHKGVSSIGQRSRVHDLRLGLHDLDADLVFLQEVQDRNERMASRHGPVAARTGQLDYLAGSGYDFTAYGKNAVYDHGHHGNAILSRWPIHRYANHDISDHALERRGMLHAVLHLAAPPAERGGARPREIHLICLHLGLIHGSRLRQARYVADFVHREIPPSAPLMIAGDFNDWQRTVDPLLRGGLGVTDVSQALGDRAAKAGGPGMQPGLRSQESFRAAARRSLAANWPWPEMPRVPRWLDQLLAPEPAGLARTFPSFAPWFALDRIYVRGFRVQSAHVPAGRAWRQRSDHAPLIAELELDAELDTKLDAGQDQRG